MISDQLREAIKQSGISTYALAKKAGVDPSAVKKFVVRERGLSLDTFDPLAETLGLVLVKQGEPAPARQPPNYEEELIQTAASMAFELFQSMGELNLDAIVAAFRARRGTGGSTR